MQFLDALHESLIKICRKILLMQKKVSESNSIFDLCPTNDYGHALLITVAYDVVNICFMFLHNYSVRRRHEILGILHYSSYKKRDLMDHKALLMIAVQHLLLIEIKETFFH